MELTILNPDEIKWMAAAIERGTGYLQRFAPDLTDRLEQLDKAYDAWYAANENRDDMAEVNADINAFSVVFGEYMKDNLEGFQWVIATDEQGSDLALFREDNQATLFPIAIVAKRFSVGSNSFFKELFGKLKQDLDNIPKE